MKNRIPFAVIFDMDGTLLKKEEVALPAFKKTFEQLKDEGIFQGEMPTDEDFMSVFGMTLKEIWNKLLPGQPEEVKMKTDRLMLHYELQFLKEGDVHLYPHVIETLQQLKQNQIALFVASNGLDEYIRGVCERFGITDYFVDLYSAGRFQTDSKELLVKKLLQDYSIDKAIMVGDRKSDIQAGKANRLFTIGCLYGFSDEDELKGADMTITDLSSLWPIIQKQYNLP